MKMMAQVVWRATATTADIRDKVFPFSGGSKTFETIHIWQIRLLYFELIGLVVDTEKKNPKYNSKVATQIQRLHRRFIFISPFDSMIPKVQRNIYGDLRDENCMPMFN